MNGFLLDTNVVSELAKRRPNAGVVQWLASDPPSSLSVLTIGELTRGALLLGARDPARSARLIEWINDLQRQFDERILTVDLPVASRWATIPAQRTLPVIDSLLAATALEHGLTVATRTTADFADTGVETLNPFI